MRRCNASRTVANISFDVPALFSEEKRPIALSKKTTFSSEKSDFSLGKWLFLY